MRLFTFGPPGTMVTSRPYSVVGAVGERLIEAAVLGLRHPIGAEANRIVRPRRSQAQACV